MPLDVCGKLGEAHCVSYFVKRNRRVETNAGALTPWLDAARDLLPVLGLVVTSTAKRLDLTPGKLNRLLNGDAAIPPVMVSRLVAYLGKDHDRL
jgi:hypothetical protein